MRGFEFLLHLNYGKIKPNVRGKIIKKLLLTLFTFIAILAHGANNSVKTVTSGDGINGKGTITYDSGDQYVGEWQDREYHGQGTLTYDNGNQYVGEWENGSKHGQHTFIWANNGRQYVGEWENDKKIGYHLGRIIEKNKYDYRIELHSFEDNTYNTYGYGLNRRSKISFDTSLDRCIYNHRAKVEKLTRVHKLVMEDLKDTALSDYSENRRRMVDKYIEAVEEEEKILKTCRNYFELKKIQWANYFDPKLKEAQLILSERQVIAKKLLKDVETLSQQEITQMQKDIQNKTKALEVFLVKMEEAKIEVAKCCLTL